MEVLGVLEKKIVNLLEYVNKLKAENALVVQELEKTKVQLVALQLEHEKLEDISNNQKDELASLKSTVDNFEHSILETKTSIDEFQEKQALTKLLVDDLILSIDSLVEQEQ